MFKIKNIIISEIAEGTQVNADLIELDDNSDFVQNLKFTDIVSDVTVQKSVNFIVSDISKRIKPRTKEIIILRNFGIIKYSSRKMITYKYAAINSESGNILRDNNVGSYIAVGNIQNEVETIENYILNI